MEVDVGGTAVRIDTALVDGDVSDAVRSYLDGDPVSFSHDVDLSGVTAFQRKVLAAVQDIPYGETRTYKTVAARIGRPNAVRAVANACRANPVPIVIPCHRVVAMNDVGGYKHGAEVKKHLLELERHRRRTGGR